MTAPDPLAMFDALEPYIETLRGLVARFVSEGFTEPEARALTVNLLCSQLPMIWRPVDGGDTA